MQGNIIHCTARTNIAHNFIRFRLELEVSYETAEVVVVMFDETAKSWVKCSVDSILETVDQEHSALPLALANIMGTKHTLELKTQTYYEHDSFESFACWKIVSIKGVDESAGLSAVAAVPDSPPPKHSQNKWKVVVLPKREKNKRRVIDDSEIEWSAHVWGPKASSYGRGQHKLKAHVQGPDAKVSFVATTQAKLGKGDSTSDERKKINALSMTQDQIKQHKLGTLQSATRVVGRAFCSFCSRVVRCG
ncbi:hypothetical protein Tco_1324033 [Tanacetum coccineum]